jgi:hypothetical protein
VLAGFEARSNVLFGNWLGLEIIPKDRLPRENRFGLGVLRPAALGDDEEGSGLGFHLEHSLGE